MKSSLPKTNTKTPNLNIKNQEIKEIFWKMERK